MPWVSEVPTSEETPSSEAPSTWLRRQTLLPARAIWTSCTHFAGRLLHDPELRRLRWILLAGLVLRLVLAPLTSWGGDTLGFARTGLLTLYSGNPYSGGTWFDPPLAPILSSPTMAIVTWIWGPDGLFQTIPALRPVALAYGYPTVQPVPAALLAWKLPLIVADLVGAIAIYYLARTHVPRISADLAAAAWMLNPLVLWVSAVHGEVDGLASALVLAAIVAGTTRHWYSAGLLLSLSVFAKGYTILLIPAFLVWCVVAPGPIRAMLRSSAGRAVAAVLGFLTGVVVFWQYLPETLGILAGRASSGGVYGGVSILMLFNAVAPRGPTWWQRYASTPGQATEWLLAFQILSVGAVLATTALLAVLLRRTTDSPHHRFSAVFACLTVAALAAIFVNPVPNSENLDVFVGLWILSLGALRVGWWSTILWGVSLAGLLEYWSLLSPLAFFYPLATLLGNGAVGIVNGVAISYFNNDPLRGGIWLALGLIGGSLLWLALTAMIYQLVSVIRRPVRPARESEGR